MQEAGLKQRSTAQPGTGATTVFDRLYATPTQSSRAATPPESPPTRQRMCASQRKLAPLHTQSMEQQKRKAAARAAAEVRRAKECVGRPAVSPRAGTMQTDENVHSRLYERAKQSHRRKQEAAAARTASARTAAANPSPRVTPTARAIPRDGRGVHMSLYERAREQRQRKEAERAAATASTATFAPKVTQRARATQLEGSAFSRLYADAQAKNERRAMLQAAKEEKALRAELKLTGGLPVTPSRRLAVPTPSSARARTVGGHPGDGHSGRDVGPSV